MTAADRRRSARHLLGEPAEIHLGPTTVAGVVADVSAHGMGLILPPGTRVAMGDVVWVLTGRVAAYAITATVVRIGSPDRERVGIQFDEILSGPALEQIQELPLVD